MQQTSWNTIQNINEARFCVNQTTECLQLTTNTSKVGVSDNRILALGCSAYEATFVQVMVLNSYF